jgi:predicted nucleic acid-binding protein
MPVEYLNPAVEDRAVAVQIALAERGQHRAASIPDVLIAATADLSKLTVLHLDKAVELIADLTADVPTRSDYPTIGVQDVQSRGLSGIDDERTQEDR